MTTTETDRARATAVKVVAAREFTNRLGASLPPSVDVAALGVTSKAPFQLLCAREALIWRTEELARNACDALERNDFAAATILTRAIVENTAVAWKLMEVLDARQSYSAKELNDILMRLLAGWKKEPGDMPEAINVLTLLKKVDKAIPGFLDHYEMLSEIAHPNWSGVFGLYSKTDRENFTTYFGRGLGDTVGTQGMVANALLGALGLFEHAYNRVSDTMPNFLSELESLWPKGGKNPTEGDGQ